MRNSIKLLGIYGSLLLLLAGCSITPTAQTSQDSTAKSDIITLSFIGDNVLGDYYGSNGETLNWYFNHKIGKDYSYFFAKVKPILQSDDMTLGNLEGPLTTHNGDRMIKPFAFKGDPSYVEILKSGSVEAVNIANNHTRDYGMQGFKDTQTHLKNAKIHYSGEGVLSIYEVKGKKIGMAGHRAGGGHGAGSP
ncbi:CapA family protein, partial [Helicobacter typhlonius]|uniref:CapA family protein n=1 Tax=Helicobacter typhlonius TaxID=76936 RepID=UPI002FDFED01